VVSGLQCVTGRQGCFGVLQITRLPLSLFARSLFALLYRNVGLFRGNSKGSFGARQGIFWSAAALELGSFREICYLFLF